MMKVTVNHMLSADDYKQARDYFSDSEIHYVLTQYGREGLWEILGFLTDGFEVFEEDHAMH